MYGQTTINGQNTLASFGAFVTEGGWNGLLAWPAFKAVKVNDWHEWDGLEPDLTAPKLDTRTAEIKLAARSVAGYHALIDTLRSKPTFTIADPSLPRAYKLRFVGFSGLVYAQGLHLFAVQVAEDTPQKLESNPQPRTDGTARTEWGIDGRDLCEFGALVLKGAEQSLRELPAVKPNLITKAANKAGATYDEQGRVTFQQREVTLPLLLVDEDRSRLWHNYNALLATLAKAGEHTLTSPTHGRGLPFYYKSMQVSEHFADAHRTWLRFTLTLVLIDGGAQTAHTAPKEDEEETA